jgi:chorismate synthase
MTGGATRRDDPGDGVLSAIRSRPVRPDRGGGRHRAAPLGGDVPLVTSARIPDYTRRHGKIVGVLRWITAGESHGPALVALLEGMVAGVEVTSDDVSAQLARRRLGYGRGARMKFEADKVTLVGGVRHGRTMGGPVAIEIANSEWPKWTEVMSADPIDETELAGMARNAPLTRPRPGHADYSGMLKYGFDDARPVLERASARETAARVAAGTLARNFLRQAFGVEVISHVVSIGGAANTTGVTPGPADLDAIDASPVRAFDTDAEAAMIAEIEAAKKDGDTLGGVVEVIVDGLPIGLGSFVSGEQRLDSRLAAALMGIQAIKGVEVGDGFETARRRGSLAHDEMRPGPDGVLRSTNRAGGLEGGMTNGEALRVRAAMKPISTVPRALSTVDMSSGEEAVAIHQRSDVCAVPAAAVVAESMVALVLAQAALEKFGGDSLAETVDNITSYVKRIGSRPHVPADSRIP